MRSDYGLYVIAIICFVIAGAVAAANIPGYTLGDASGITVVMIFLLIGIISGAVGYSTKPKEMMPITQPAPTTPMREEEMPAPTREASEDIQPPPPAPIEQMTTTAEEEPKRELEAEVTVPQEPSAPTPSTPMEASPPETEQPVANAEVEKPKPARRRRKKAQ
jgi:hypothetical protein